MLTPAAFEDKRELQERLILIRVIAVVVFALLAVAFWLLQIIQHDKYEAWADKNYIRQIPLRAPRGVLFDRTGHVLVENRDSFTIAFLRERTPDLDEAIRRLAEALAVDEALVREPIQRAISRREPVFRPIPIVQHATFDQVVAVRARKLELPEVLVQQVPTRHYPDSGLAAHLFGYVGEIQAQQIGRPEYTGLEDGAIVGQTGLERIYNARLQGADGRRNVVVNSVGREIEELPQDNPADGARMQLTIDHDMQKALEEGFRAYGYNGAAAFIDPRNGEVLAMTSLPAYDPNDFASGIARDKWSGLNRDPLTPLNNRVIQGRYAPGSTFKIVTAIAALGEKLITPETRVTCTGGANFYGRYFQCHKAGGHGSVDLRTALEKSCNVYFYTLGEKLKIDMIHDYAKRLGLVGRTGIDLPNEQESIVASTEWNMREHKSPWYPGETISVSIGQGKVAVTPIALATMISTVANGGKLVTPHLVKAVDPDGKGWQQIPTPMPRANIPLSDADVQAVREGLWRVVNAGGTAPQARIEGKDVAGKTGTAQVISLSGARLAAGKMDVRDHGFFVFFAPRDNPRIAGIVFAEHAQHGYSAAPIAKYVMETFFAKEDGRPLPEPPKVIRAAAAPPPVARPNSGNQNPGPPPSTPAPQHPSTAGGRRR
jgi:penicillin-binding protein 2